MPRRLQYLLPALLSVFCAGFMPAAAGEAIVNAGERSAIYDEVMAELASRLEKDRNAAQDAAAKLARLGKHAVPVLTELMARHYGKETGNQQAGYYCVWALAQINSAEAFKPLLPLLTAADTPAQIRQIVIKAVGLEHSKEGMAQLQGIAAKNEDPLLRKEAFAQLSVMPTAWVASEKTFVDALSDPDDDIRTLAAKQCYTCRLYKTAIPKLVSITEADPCEAARLQAMLALGRMRTQQAVPALVRVIRDTQSSVRVQQQALRAVQGISGVTLKDAAAVEKWWEKFGEKEYSKIEEAFKDLARKKEEDAQDASTSNSAPQPPLEKKETEPRPQEEH